MPAASCWRPDRTTRPCGCGDCRKASCCALCDHRSGPGTRAKSGLSPWRPMEPGSLLAGGTPPLKRPGQTYVYIFEPTSGAISARVGPFGEVIATSLSRPDGRYLAVTLGAGHGVRVWEKTSTSWRAVGEDREYGGSDAYGAAFDSAGLLYTVAYDGKLRQYAIRLSFQAQHRCNSWRCASLLRSGTPLTAIEWWWAMTTPRPSTSTRHPPLPGATLQIPRTRRTAI